ncbi:Pkinase-domain-containing protein [Flagelloscypha sp. PMI_526]|nr:Pkinase-domain-containing protein [Flagelloscypha sp. PMI_526]
MQQVSVHQLYKRLETVGKGAYGSVHKGLHIPTGNLVALKIINLDTSDDDVEDIQREVALLTQLRDAPNITKYYGCYMDGPRVWIAMELAQGGSVLSLMKVSPDNSIEERFVAVIIRETLVALAYLHRVPVIHRDMKAANILVSSTGKVMICDFGVSALLATTSSKRNTLTGTPYWMAPEVVQSVPAYDTKADIWSLGIMIYEMMKGQPPHAHLDKFKVMDLIPRARPPTLAENEGSVDMRAFMALCLKESPTERLPAEELAKTKWMKSVSRTPIGILKELVSRLQQAGPRASLAGPLDWEEEELNARRFPRESNGWEFDTVRSREWMDAGFQDGDEDSFQSTVRPPAAPLPLSLRSIFEDESAPQPEPWRIPQHPSSSHRDSPSGPAPVGPRKPRRQGSTDSTASLTTDESVSGSPFVFPPRTRPARQPSQPKSRPPPISADEDSSTEAVIDLRLLSAGLSDSDRDTSTDTITPPAKKSSMSSRFKVPPNIEVPPRHSGVDIDPQKSADDTTPSTASTDKTPQSARQFITRKRSQSTAESISSARRGWSDSGDDVNLASPAAFQFPPNGKGDQTPSPSQHRSQRADQHAAVKSGSPGLVSPSAHQMTYSLDQTTARRLVPPELRSPPPPMNRTRSATALPVESHYMTPESPLIPPIKPFARVGRERSGSGSEGAATMGTPTLKDVLKIPSLSSEHHMGMTDLLPPSPSAVAHSRPIFAPSPSHLGNSAVIADQNQRDAALAAPSPYNLPRSTSPPPFDPSTTTTKPPAPSETTISAFGSSLGQGPAVRPLDFMALVNGTNAYTELAHTIEDLSQWLSIVESGFGEILDAPLSKQGQAHS